MASFQEGDQPVNFYGSGIADVDEENEEEEEVVDITAEEPENAASARIYCSCSGQCARKRGRGACPCKEGNLECVNLCKCSKSKCKNQATATVVRSQDSVVPDGADRFEADVQQSATAIQEFIGGLDEPVKDRLLVRLLSMGRGSLDFAKQLLTPPPVADSLPEEPTPPPPSNLPWCKCRVCIAMETEQENVCCKKRQCITSYRSFNNICLDRDILEVCIKARCDIRADEFNFSMESFRKAAYRQFALWRYGKMGRGNRRVIPSCAVKLIRQAYPSPDGRHMGFRNN